MMNDTITSFVLAAGCRS